MDLFSESESKLLKLLGRRKVSIVRLTGEFFDEPVLDANIKVGGIIHRINRKCEYHDLDWFVNGEGGGRAGKVVWKERR